MRRWADSASYAGLLLLVLLAPLPLGSYRYWSWSLVAAAAAVVALPWVLSQLAPAAAVGPRLPRAVPILFAVAVGWAMLQTVAWTPAGWHHPLWSMAGSALQQPLAGRVSISPQDGWTALARLLGYALVFLLALQLGSDRRRAQAMFGWLTLAGVAYAVFALLSYWGAYQPTWLFGEQAVWADLRGTFMNRNHYATWQGLTVVCAIAWFYHRLAQPDDKPYAVPKDQETRVEEFVLKAWQPMTALLLMVAALILTHSRGGFLATLAGVAALLWLLDRRSRAARLSSRVWVITALAVAGLAFYLTSEVLLDRINRTDITTEQRLQTFESVNRAIGDNPVLGFGYGTFASAYRLYDPDETALHYYHAHNTWLENAFELGLPAALCLFGALFGLALVCLRGVRRRHRDWVYPAAGAAASVLVGLHATVDFSLQLPAVAVLYALVMGVACAQCYSSARHHA